MRTYSLCVITDSLSPIVYTAPPSASVSPREQDTSSRLSSPSKAASQLSESKDVAFAGNEKLSPCTVVERFFVFVSRVKMRQRGERGGWESKCSLYFHTINGRGGKGHSHVQSKDWRAGSSLQMISTKARKSNAQCPSKSAKKRTTSTTGSAVLLPQAVQSLIASGRRCRMTTSSSLRGGFAAITAATRLQYVRRSASKTRRTPHACAKWSTDTRHSGRYISWAYSRVRQTRPFRSPSVLRPFSGRFRNPTHGNSAVSQTDARHQSCDPLYLCRRHDMPSGLNDRARLSVLITVAVDTEAERRVGFNRRCRSNDGVPYLPPHKKGSVVIMREAKAQKRAQHSLSKKALRPSNRRGCFGVVSGAACKARTPPTERRYCT